MLTWQLAEIKCYFMVLLLVNFSWQMFPTAQKTYIKHFSYRKLQTSLSPAIHSKNTRTSCLQPGLIVSFTEQQTGQ